MYSNNVLQFRLIWRKYLLGVPVLVLEPNHYLLLNYNHISWCVFTLPKRMILRFWESTERQDIRCTVYVQGFSTQSVFYISTMTFYSLHFISNNNNSLRAFIKISKHRNINRYWTNNFPNFCICALKILREVISQNY